MLARSPLRSFCQNPCVSSITSSANSRFWVLLLYPNLFSDGVLVRVCVCAGAWVCVGEGAWRATWGGVVGGSGGVRKEKREIKRGHVRGLPSGVL